MDIKIVDNFLPKTYLEHLQSHVLGYRFPWYYHASGKKRLYSQAFLRELQSSDIRYALLYFCRLQVVVIAYF